MNFSGETILKSNLQVNLQVILLALVWSAPGFAQKLVDPSTVAPEYREAAVRQRQAA